MLEFLTSSPKSKELGGKLVCLKWKPHNSHLMLWGCHLYVRCRTQLLKKKFFYGAVDSTKGLPSPTLLGISVHASIQRFLNLCRVMNCGLPSTSHVGVSKRAVNSGRCLSIVRDLHFWWNFCCSATKMIFSAQHLDTRVCLHWFHLWTITSPIL